MSNKEQTFADALKELNDALVVATKQIADSFNDAAEQLHLQRQCKMRRFCIDFYGNRIVEGVVFSEECIVVRDALRTIIYPSVESVREYYGSAVKFIDPEPGQ